MSQIPSSSSQSKSARSYLCSSQKFPRLAHLQCHNSFHAPCEQVSAPSSRGSGKQLHHDAIHPSQRASPASQGLACVTLAESQSPQQSWHQLQISISKENFSMYFALQLSNSVPVTALLPQQECQVQNC